MSTATAAPELKTYNGNCHCGAFKFHLIVPELTSVTECSCSICHKKGYKWVFPGEGGFIVDKGEGTLTDYNFGQKTMAHRFCPKCGTGIMGFRHGEPAASQLAVNARALMDVDLWSLKVNPYDGTDREPHYIPPQFKGDLPIPKTTLENPKTYTGACHCGLVTLAFIANGALTEGKEYIQECDCSICARNGTILTYPHKSQVIIANKEALTRYSFGRNFQNHDFCPVCGVAVCIEKLDIGPEKLMENEGNGDYVEWLENFPVNLRLFEGVEWAVDVKEGEKSVVVKRGNWSKWGTKYVVPE